MNPSWFSLQTLGGIVGALLFAGLCHKNMRAAILVFTALGCVTAIQVGAFAGNEMVTGLLPVELLATVMLGVWTLQRLNGHHRIRRTPFNLPLFLLIPVSFVSLLIGFTWFDPTIPIQNLKAAVSIGQILLLVWPIGVYVVVASTVDDERTIKMLRTLIIVLSVPSLLIPLGVFEFRRLEWSTAFALPASSLCFARFFSEKAMPRKVGLLIVTFAPVLYGFTMGKAFFYSYVLVSTATIVWLRARHVAVLIAPAALACYVVAVPLASDSLTPAFLRSAVETETAQQSLGGSAGRDQLIRDGLNIWSRYPLLGVGPGNNYPYMLRYSTLGTAHNQYINIMMELGLVGLGCFVAFAFQAMRMGLRLWHSARNPLHSEMALAWLGLFAAMIAGGVFGDFMLPSIRNGGLELLSLFYVQWILLGVLVSMATIERRYRNAS